jgi:hypothetical protein
VEESVARHPSPPSPRVVSVRPCRDYIWSGLKVAFISHTYYLRRLVHGIVSHTGSCISVGVRLAYRYVDAKYRFLFVGVGQLMVHLGDVSTEEEEGYIALRNVEGKEDARQGRVHREKKYR